MTWRPHVAALRASMTSRINILRAVSGRDWGADRDTLLMLYRCMVRPKMEYGSELFSCAADSTVSSLFSVQYQCLRIATGSLTGVRADSLAVETNVLPLRLHFAYVALQTAAAIISLAGHPLLFLFDGYDRYLRLLSPLSVPVHTCCRSSITRLCSGLTRSLLSLRDCGPCGVIA